LFPFEPNQSVVLAKDEVVIKDNENALFSSSAEIRLDLLPRPRIHICIKKKLSDIEMSELTIGMWTSESFMLELNNKKRIKGYMMPSHSSNCSVIFLPSSGSIIGVGDDDTQMQYVVFHLFNFEETHSKHIHLEDDNWIVELKSLAESKNTFDRLTREGGYGLTHVGCFRKKDNTLISDKEARDMLYALDHFFSFAKGTWCNLVCPVGFTSSCRVWEAWSSPSGPSFSNPFSWFSGYCSEQLMNLFPGFMNKWNDEEWNDTLQKSIYWYLNANTSNTDVGIILSQTALERLSFDYVVLKRKLISEDSFRHLKASDNFKLLFSLLELPIDINKDLDDFEKMAKEKKWENGPQGMSEIRNSLVHPKPKNKGKFKSVYYNAWKLGLWYVELALLKLCEYSGNYFNRITESIELVPWEK